jgi:hypothetical protein
MIITSHLQYLCRGEDSTLNYTANENDLGPSLAERPLFLDPKLLRVARQLYRNYCVHNPQSPKRPLGIAIHKHTHRGQLMFKQQPILLPGECFVSVKQLDLEAC